MKTKKKTRTDIIREYLMSLPASERKPTAVAEALRARGCRVTRGHVSVVKTTMHRRESRSMGRDLVAAKKFLSMVGGSQRAKELIDIVGRVLR
jgi:hypothetical protein